MVLVNFCCQPLMAQRPATANTCGQEVTLHSPPSLEPLSLSLLACPCLGIKGKLVSLCLREALVTDGLISWSLEMQPHTPFMGSLMDPVSQPSDPGASGGQVPIPWGWGEGSLRVSGQ